MRENRDLRDAVLIFWALIIVAATIYIGWAQNDPKIVLKPHHDYRSTALGVLGASAFFSSAKQPLQRVFRTSIQKHREPVREMLSALVLHVCERADWSLPVQSVGATAWLVRRGLREPQLKLLARYRIAALPQESDIRWTKGKGIIGECWEADRESIVDSGRIDAKYGSCDQGKWDAAPDSTRRNLPYDEYVKIRNKYGTVAVIPLRDKGGKLVGVLALDAPRGHHATMEQPEVMHSMASTAKTISEKLFESAG